MEIKTKADHTVRFGDIEFGETFKFNGDVYLRVDFVQRAVCLNDGQMAVFMENTYVKPVILKCEEV